MSNLLPINLNFDLEAFQQGALDCKQAVIEMRQGMNEIELNVDETDANFDSILNASQLAHRTHLITNIVEQLGNFTQYQTGFISALLEYIEMTTDGGVEPSLWQPSAISGEWQ